MVSVGLGKFYGTSLPRPRIYTDVKFNDRRVDPPTPVNGPLMSWAAEGHWSMGDLSFKRLRLQGKIEGNVERLRSQHEKGQAQSPPPPPRSVLRGSKGASSPSLPPAPFVTKRRRVASLENEGAEMTWLKTRSSRLVKGVEAVKKTVVEAAENSNRKTKKITSEAAEETVLELHPDWPNNPSYMNYDVLRKL
ncbi:hypothetical protein JHK82_037665 [Glycine max]|nr:hypothetical protein JHK85_038418 [Glycine max]KAG5114396.1 hypothetical protein JHK82_037665 [Glycine max]